MEKSYQFDWGIFSLVEFLGAHSFEIGSRFNSALDIGSGDGQQTNILRHAGLEVFQVDKYSSNAEFKEDFNFCNFDRKFDVIYCSHVIEHQRNVGNFLDKIFDSLSEDGLLLISAPKHDAKHLIEGHLNCFYLSYFIQQLIHAGFDLKRGKLLSCNVIENSAIVGKASNFNLSERNESGYEWTKSHQERSPIELRNCEVQNDAWIFQNCNILSYQNNKIAVNLPSDYCKLGIHINGKRWGVEFDL